MSIDSDIQQFSEHHLIFMEWHHCPILEFDLSGKLLYINLAGRTQFPQISKLDADHPVLSDFTKLIKDIKPTKNLMVAYSKEMTVNNAVYSTQIIAHPAKNIVFVYLIDITHEKQVEKEINKLNKELEQRVVIRTQELVLAKERAEYLSHKAEEASRLKSEFLANMSHELRTPLNAIIGFSELMYNGKVGPILDEHKEYLSDILSSSRHLLQLINDVLDLSKVEAGVVEFNPQPTQLASTIREVLDTLHPLILKKKITVNQFVDDSVNEVVVDKGKLKQILYNYLSNAIKFSNPEGVVEIKVGLEDKTSFKIAITDNSIGIRPENIDKLFIAFQQLDISSSKKYQGTGLGLALTRRLVEAQGGRVGVDSTYGVGSTFYAILPLRLPIKKNR